jgi:Leucine-rich repeat (LRR) protein
MLQVEHIGIIKNIDVCDWYGVRCERGEVAGLSFEANNLTGSCPPIILELPFLEELNLSDNDIEFNFEYIHTAKQLKQLHLKNTLTSMLNGIGSATNLTVLNLAGNHLEQTIPDELLQLRLLRELDISNNKFQGTLSDKIINLQELEVFNCSENFINGSIPYQIGGLQRLRTLDLSNNKLTGKIPTSFLQLIHLEKLSLMNQTSKGGVGLGGRLPSFLSNQALTEIKLNSNSLTGTIPSNFLHALDPSLLVSIDLRSNQLSGNLPNDLIRFENLEILLVDNKITQLPRSYCSKSKWMKGKVGSYGCDAILCPANTYNSATGRQESNESVCEKCSSRHFTSPYLGSSNCRSLGAKQRAMLEKLYNSSNGDMWHNNTNWMSHVADPCDWYGIACNENGDVISINLENNNVQGMLPVDVFYLPALIEINLNLNPISVLFDGIGNATNLEVLYLDLTDLKSLAGIGQAYHLKEIHSSFNEISGLLPDELSKLSGLKILDLSDNRISGHLPSFLGNLLSLETLRLKSNSLSGHLPNFYNLTNLTTLDLSYNSFSGSIPLSFLQNTNVSESVFVDLSHNQFTGTLPNSLARLNRLSIHLQENRIEGLDDALCQKTDWLNNEVGLYGCDGILCPKGTFNDVGRQSTNDTPCVPCMETRYYGSTACSYRSSETTTSSSVLKAVASSAQSKLLWNTLGVEINGATVPLFAFAMVTGILFIV